MSRTKARQGVKVASGWCSLATILRGALEDLTTASSALLAEPSPPNKARLQAAHDRAVGALLQPFDGNPLLVRPFLFGEHPIVLSDRETFETWPLHFFPLGEGRSCLRLGENVMIFEADGTVLRSESTVTPGSTQAEALARAYDHHGGGPGQPPKRAYFQTGTQGRAWEEGSYQALYKKTVPK